MVIAIVRASCDDVDGRVDHGPDFEIDRIFMSTGRTSEGSPTPRLGQNWLRVVCCDLCPFQSPQPRTGWESRAVIPGGDTDSGNSQMAISDDQSGSP
jgi:hypothetical protein